LAGRFDFEHSLDDDENDEICIRGLEGGLTPCARMLANQRRRRIIQAVLDVQDSTTNPEDIQACANRFSVMTTVEALERASQDAVWAGYNDTTALIRQTLVDTADVKELSRPCLVLNRKPSVRDCGGLLEGSMERPVRIPIRNEFGRDVSKEVGIMVVSSLGPSLPRRRPSFRKSPSTNTTTAPLKTTDSAPLEARPTMPVRLPSTPQSISNATTATDVTVVPSTAPEDATATTTNTVNTSLTRQLASRHLLEYEVVPKHDDTTADTPLPTLQPSPPKSQFWSYYMWNMMQS
jgi:hypothetical protein